MLVSTTVTDGNLFKLCVMFHVAEGMPCVNTKLASSFNDAIEISLADNEVKLIPVLAFNRTEETVASLSVSFISA